MLTGGHCSSSAWSTQAVRIASAARWVNCCVVRVSGLVVIFLGRVGNWIGGDGCNFATGRGVNDNFVNQFP